MNTTVRMKASEIYKDWHVIDAAGRPLGRVATEAAILLRGKHKPTYEPHLDDGDFVIIINAAQVKVTGRKAEQIKYHTHSGFPGGLHTRSYSDQLAQHPERVLEKAVWGMLPGGPLGEAIFRHLKVYKGAHHPHESQVTGSARAQAARLEARDGIALQPRKAPPRLRRLSVPDVAAEVEAVPEPVASPLAAEPKPVRAKARKAVAAAPVEPKPARAKARKAVAAAPVEPKPARAKARKAVAAAPVEPAARAKARKAAPARPAEPAAPTAEPPVETPVAKVEPVSAPVADAAEAAPRRRTRAKVVKETAAEPTVEAAAEAKPAEPKPARRRAAAKTKE